MRIAIHTPMFLPRIGGLEILTSGLADYFTRRGHEVRVLTVTPAGEGTEPGVTYGVVRHPSQRDLFAAVKWCDVFFHANVSLKALHPLLVYRRPWVVSHQGWYHDLDNSMTWQAAAKRWLSKFATNIACSQAVADYMGTPCEVVPNPYDDRIFREYPDIKRERDLLFVGRLVSDKGANLLLHAAAKLSRQGIAASVTITGSGPEELPLRQQCKALGLEPQVEFTGPLRGESLARCMNAHRILVVPSIWREPFGIVAVEGIACGCVVVGSRGGGLKEAIGPCGLTFANGDVSELAAVLSGLLGGSTPTVSFTTARPGHLQQHTLTAAGDAYLRTFQKAVSRQNKNPDQSTAVKCS